MRLLRTLSAAGLIAGLAGASALAAPTAHAATPTTVLTRDVLPGIASVLPTGTPASTTRMDLGISIAGKNPAALAAYIAREYDASSPDYHRFLTPASYAANFGATPKHTTAARQWLAAGGLTIDNVSTAGTLIDAHGTVAQVEALMHVTEKSYRSGTGLAFIAATSAPTVLANAGITEVTGLETLNVAHTAAQVMPADFPVSSQTVPSDLWTIYDQPTTNRGSGQDLTAFGWGNPDGVVDDFHAFETNNKLPIVPFNLKILGDKATTAPDNAEWDLDSQASTGMAPDAKSITFYFVNAGNVTLISNAIQTWADDPNGSQQSSGSYGLCEALAATGEFNAHELALQQAVSEGRSFFASTGDNGSGCSAAVNTNGITVGPVPSQEFPATSQYSVAVGGTVVYATGTATETGAAAAGSTVSRQSEIAWTHGGGGPAHFEARPSWQDILSDTTRNPLTAAQVAGQQCIGDYAGDVVSPTGSCRVESDVSAQGGDLVGGYETVVGGTTEAVAGTSLAAPLWQGMWARINAAAPKNASGTYTLGYANPILYGIYADTAKYASDFYDVTTGANGAYSAGTGWDYPTGLGTPDVAHLMTGLTGRLTPVNPSAPNPVAGSGTGGGVVVVNPCPAYPQVTDPEGDATYVVIEDSGVSALDVPNVDITSAGFTYDAVKNALTAHITVANLTASPEQGTGENYRFIFNVGTTQYQLQAAHSAATDATTYTFGGYGVGASSTSTTGTRNTATNEITMDLPAALFTSVVGTNLVPGLPISAFSVNGQRQAGTTTLTADDAAASCTYAVGAAAAAAALPEAPYLPLLVLVGIAPVGVLVLRRRRLE